MVKISKIIKCFIISLLIIFFCGLVMPEKIMNPVQGANTTDWNHQTFWYEPWGTSGVHKGIDIFGTKNTPVVASVTGIVMFSGQLTKGGNVVAILGPKWRIHYYAHLDKILVDMGEIVSINQKIGTLGDSGNASGKQPHVHYSILSLIPYPWLATTESQGWKRMFYLNPHEKLND